MDRSCGCIFLSRIIDLFFLVGKPYPETESYKPPIFVSFLEFALSSRMRCRIILKASFVAYGSPVFGSRYLAGKPVITQTGCSGYS
uniref:Uncharacterized protein n=1 Tax=Medicago truncatula TaxID=3880 RepID=I3S622_MEDTR|nr:unknown [Medicago truncatula]